MTSWFVLAGLLACSGPRARDVNLEVCQDNAGSQDSGGYGYPEEQFDAVGGVGVIEVRHSDIQLNCCTKRVAVRTDVRDDAIDLRLVERGQTCKCSCAHDLDYTLAGVDAGRWTVTWGDQSVTVDVAPPE